MKKKFNIQSLSPQMSTPRATRTDIPSLYTPGDDCTLKEIPKYTGDQMIGISIIHKSCLQPIFSQQEAIDAATMRR